MINRQMTHVCVASHGLLGESGGSSRSKSMKFHTVFCNYFLKCAVTCLKCAAFNAHLDL